VHPHIPVHQEQIEAAETRLTQAQALLMDLGIAVAVAAAGGDRLTET